jgi:2-iminobutanoate/2-iminopropanoate deaminase
MARMKPAAGAAARTFAWPLPLSQVPRRDGEKREQSNGRGSAAKPSRHWPAIANNHGRVLPFRMNTGLRLPSGLSIAALVTAILSATPLLVGCGSDVAPVPASPVSEVFAPNTERGYSMASRYGDLVWTAGHLPESVPVTESVGKQTEAVMDSLQDTLEQAGAGLDTVVMTNAYLTDFDDWEAFNAVYRQYFPDRLPPRVTVQVGQLGLGYSVEISMVAHVRGQ